MAQHGIFRMPAVFTLVLSPFPSEADMIVRMRAVKQLCAIACACALLAGCAAAGTSIISGAYWYPSARRDRWPVAIVAADGQFHAQAREVPLDPGTHTLILESLKPPILHLRVQQAFLVKTDACKRYYLAAQHSGPLDDKWEPVIDRVDDLPWCSAGSSQGGVTTPAPAEPRLEERKSN
jgi:hypothetical protein